MEDSATNMELLPTSGVISRKLDFQHRTLPQILQIQSAMGDRVLLRCDTLEVTYAQAPNVAASYAARLAQEGVGPGDRVVVFMSNRIEQLELWLGVAWLGAVFVPINISFRGEQLRHAIAAVEPKLIVSETSLLEYLSSVEALLEKARGVFFIDNQSTTVAIGAIEVSRFEPADVGLPPYEVKPGDAAAILCTSGTTGPAKGVICPHAQFYWWGVLTGEALGIGEDDVLFTVLPLFHTNALNTLWQALIIGATYSFSQTFSARGFWQQAQANGATVTYLLGSMAQILLNQKPQDLDKQHSIRVALCPATPLEIVKKFDARFGVGLIEGYGSTETNFVFSNVIEEYAPASMGRVADGFEVRIVDDYDCEVAEGEAGELIIRHSEPFSMSSGYFRNPVATADAWRNLWYHTGDRVFRDSSGVYHFIDRMVDAIRRRGENISSWEVESALTSHPDIELAAVIGVPSDLGSEDDVMAFVVMCPGCTPDPVKIIRFLESRLAYFAIPRYWEFPQTLPTTSNNKMKKHVLRKQGITASTWDREKAGVMLDRMAKNNVPKP